MPTIQVIGVHPIKAEVSVHLIEVLVSNSRGVFNATLFTQEDPKLPKDNWQVAYSEVILNSTGDKILAEGFDADQKPELWKGNVRMAFFLHFLDVNRPILTPFGEAKLPKVSPLPSRMRIVKYESPG